jgi:selenocysteine lyase/cysteine desulfurase
LPETEIQIEDLCQQLARVHEDVKQRLHVDVWGINPGKIPGVAPPPWTDDGYHKIMDEWGIAASSGSACTSGSLQPSHVLRAMGVPFTMAHGSIRFSLSIYNTEKEIDFVIDTLPAIIENLRALSPYWEVGDAVCARVEV